QQTAEGGYIVAGHTYSNDGDVSANYGGSDCWLLKLDASGNIEWEKSLGGDGEEYAYSIQQTTDGGYIIAGYSNSADGDVPETHDGSIDFWIVKLAPEGTADLGDETIINS